MKNANIGLGVVVGILCAIGVVAIECVLIGEFHPVLAVIVGLAGGGFAAGNKAKSPDAPAPQDTTTPPAA